MNAITKLLDHTHDLVDTNDLMRARYARMGYKLGVKEAEHMVRQARRETEECKGIAVGVWLIGVAILYATLELFMDQLYNFLDRLGVIAWVAHFVGW